MRNYRLLLHFLMLFLFGFSCLSVWAAEPYIPRAVNPLAESWRWKTFPELEGKGVSHIMEGPDHRVWVSCNEGIYEYNGYKWNLHNAADGLDVLPAQQVLAAKDGQIYATTPSGIFHYDGARWTALFRLPTGLQWTFNQIKELADGSIMACSNAGVLHLTRRKTPDFYTTRENTANLKLQLPDMHFVTLPKAVDDGRGFLEISDILEDRAGVMWFAVTLPGEVGRLLKFRLPAGPKAQISDYELIVSDATLKIGENQKLIQAENGKIWVINSTYKTGIAVFDGAQRQYIRLSDLFGGDEFATEIVESSDGAIWIGSLGKLYRFKNGAWSLFSAPNYAIPANSLMLQKSAGNKLWVAGYKTNVFQLDFSTDRWATYPDLNFQCEMASGEQWFLEVHGKVVRRKGDTWTAFGVADGLMDAPIRIIVTSTGQLWAAGSHQGVAATAELKTGGWVRMEHPNLSWGIDYRAVFEAADGALWFGGAVDNELDQGQRGGVLQLINPGSPHARWVHHEYGQNGLIQSNSYGIGQSRDGNIWIGGSSLFYYNGKQWQQPTDKRLQQPVNVVCSTPQWLIAGSRYYGIFIFDGKTWKNYSTTNGLSSNTIISIDIVSERCILVATENGICRFDGETWVRNIFPPELTMDFEGGMLLHDSEGAVWINKSSRAWKRRSFKHSKRQEGLSRNFVAYRYRFDGTPPETAITFADDEVTSDGNALIKWAGKDYFAQSAEDRLTFSWRLDDGPWSAFGSENHYTFIGLANGRHTLEVRARDLDLNVDPSPAITHFTVLPPVWKQGWFIALIFAFLIIIGIYEYRLIAKKQELEKRNQKIERQRDQLEKMVVQVESLSKARLRFFTNISHELRTPLTLISGPVEQLQQSGDNLSPAEHRRLYGIIERNASRLLKLINQLLEVRRLEQTTPELNLQELNLADYVGDMVRLFENLAEERNIYLDFKPPGTIAPGAVDPDKIEKIVVNLLSNAFKHTPDGGSITVSLEVVNAGAAKLPMLHDQYFKIEVADTGSGIRPEVQEHIFESYYSPEAGKTDSLSSGIGLAYTKDLLDALHGRIQVESAPGRGSRFSVYFPCLPLQHVQAPQQQETPALRFSRKEADLLLSAYAGQHDASMQPQHAGTTTRRILIVEDNPDMQSFLEGILGAKFRIITAGNGLEGLVIARQQAVDLIISDVMMPEMDGFTFCEKIKSDPATSHIPVIMLTAKTLDENKMEGYQKGADGYIVKPFNPRLLEVRAETLLKQREHLQEVYNRDFLLRPKEVHLTSFDETFLVKLAEMMEEYLEEPDFNVHKMCEMVNLSHMHFIRKVKQLTGKKPSDLLKTFRLKRAKDLLSQNKLTIAEVAYKVGYDVPSSLSRAFKKEFGVSPTEFVE